MRAGRRGGRDARGAAAAPAPRQARPRPREAGGVTAQRAPRGRAAHSRGGSVPARGSAPLGCMGRLSPVRFGAVQPGPARRGAARERGARHLRRRRGASSASPLRSPPICSAEPPRTAPHRRPRSAAGERRGMRGSAAGGSRNQRAISPPAAVPKPARKTPCRAAPRPAQPRFVPCCSPAPRACGNPETLRSTVPCLVCSCPRPVPIPSSAHTGASPYQLSSLFALLLCTPAPHPGVAACEPFLGCRNAEGLCFQPLLSGDGKSRVFGAAKIPACAGGQLSGSTPLAQKIERESPSQLEG